MNPDPKRDTIDLATPHGTRAWLLYDDDHWRPQFAEALELQLDEMVEALAACFRRFRPMQHAAIASGNPRVGWMMALAQGVLDDLVVSTKLLLVGKLAASGNIARQAIEGLAMAMLCSTEEPLVIEQDRKKGPTRAVYWRKVQGGDRRVQAQHAVRQLRWNIDRVPADATWISFLEAGQKRFHGVSHAGPVAMAVRIPLSGTGPISFGGHFDPEKESLYRLELIHRTNLCRQLSMLMDLLPSTIPLAEADRTSVS
ncbi:hypothetical protein GSH03_21140 [Burkholderia pseudomallei]|uniref:hypothetical protein n=1 Tax=Burkholderia pseudomallei TaxID=28450 RepID=UPI0019402578|nr:hypothetical protein [Burkholderia pseudomallei]MBM5690971.1 hypothetical protein [Burkholderia pseudomallei]